MPHKTKSGLYSPMNPSGSIVKAGKPDLPPAGKLTGEVGAGEVVPGMTPSKKSPYASIMGPDTVVKKP